jgi:hypothetical protein
LLLFHLNFAFALLLEGSENESEKFSVFLPQKEKNFFFRFACCLPACSALITINEVMLAINLRLSVG